MEITISKNIYSLRAKLTDDLIIKSLFDKVILTNPRRCKINLKNEIVIKNYGITKKQDNWIKSNPIMTGFNRWQLISDAKFKIDNLTNLIIYKIDIKLIILFNSLFLTIFPLLTGFGISKGSGDVKYGLKIGLIVFAVYLSLITIGLIFKYMRHKNLIDEFINELTN